MDITEPITIDDTGQVIRMIKILYSKDIESIRNGDEPIYFWKHEVKEIKRIISEHPDWDDYEVASWIIDGEGA